jgi:hypothetical protein
MRCEEIRELFHEYTARGLDQDQKLWVESHVRDCEDCGLFFRESNELWNILDNWDRVEPGDDFVAGFWKRVSEEDVKKNKILDFFRNLKLNWALGAALAVIMVVSVITLNVFHSDRANVVFTENDEADEELLIKLDKAISRETATALDIYGPWKQFDKNN